MGLQGPLTLGGYQKGQRPFELLGSLHNAFSQTDAGPDDVVGVKRALNRMGFYDVPDYGMTPYADRTMFDGIRRFQRANGLRVDGVMQRGRATEHAMNDGLRRASAERPERPKPGDDNAQRIKELEARLEKLNNSIEGFQSLIRHAQIAGDIALALNLANKLLRREEERKNIEAELSRLKREK